ncbi:MAG: hypothetical protein A3A33_00235 [Candidatus Yanofskybacteria bacterium RIFCSPLOWO2_01_FULL_49_25]|uniref:Uncharacterized protein n=1 Tax=Candidatus Yanofskybacteria bacterium RIFCSPLOWO2_01_FULL_49_25 TaxID=1802701 RepID=A0A1F8GVQ4_9BACT|nr:MAG: hypothetical protein A3A33_00235 [Candidatus Yanofskybacteria bacterium RIFCSPLOWO2_01_FULL_49_25]
MFISKFFDKLEDKIRHRLSKHPVLYSLIAGFAVVLFWRGVWDLMDQLEFMTPIVSLIISVTILLLTGTFVSFFIGDQIIISGIKSEKRTDEKTEEEIKTEEVKLSHVDKELEELKREIEDLAHELHGKKIQ